MKSLQAAASSDELLPTEADARRSLIDARLAEIGFRLEDHNAYLIRLAHQRATQLFQSTLENRGITPVQLAVLATLLRHGRMAQNSLGKLTAIDTATLSPMMRRLQKLGFIERAPSEQDQRVNLVDLTPAGIDFTLEVLPLSIAVSEQVLAPLKPRDRERFIQLLRQIT